ncbi:MAG: 2''''-5'''' RNA ligase [Candidatus Moranbacteria bacterium GW2011_GWA2_39_41]|nr:MAG: 2''''-5'''' RNA ligase [Candidatus Moranbacteria bacterium GW2011_GWA2_39_41]
MKRKIFININLPDRTKKRLSRAIERWVDLPVKWVREENLHVSLFFLGFVDDDSTYEVCEAVTRAAQTEEIFDIEFDTIKLSPSAEDPRVVVVTGKPNENLRNLAEKIEKELGIFTSAKKEFRPNITLGKVRKNIWQDLSEKPVINKEFPLLATVESVDVMASNFEGDDAEFVIVESCQLV